MLRGHRAKVPRTLLMATPSRRLSGVYAASSLDVAPAGSEFSSSAHPADAAQGGRPDLSPRRRYLARVRLPRWRSAALTASRGVSPTPMPRESSARSTAATDPATPNHLPETATIDAATDLGAGAQCFR